MKKLEELGISPAPWEDGYGHYVASAGKEGERLCVASDVRSRDLKMIAAAPKLYKWLLYAVEHYKCETRSCDKCPNGKCWIVDATAALAEAAGESDGE